MGDDFYEILGVPATASGEEIKQAYFALARQYHPDTNPSDSANEYFLILQRAYETLRNPKKRKEYELLRTQPGPETARFKVTCRQSTFEISVNPEPQLVYALIDIESPENAEIVKPASIHLCFVIDCSTSMKGSRLDMVKDCLYRCTKDLSSQDLVSIVAFNDFAEIILTPTRLKDLDKINNKIQGLSVGGGTEIYKGLKAGADLLWEGNSNTKDRHLILLTDGHTYGDEEGCYQLAEKAREQEITITTFGIGNDWNDKFLDKLANLTGGSSIFIYRPEDLYNYLQQLTSSLKTIFAHNTSIDVICNNLVKLNNIFRIEPFVAELGLRSPIYIGDLHANRTTRLLLAFQVDEAVMADEDFRLASGFIKSETRSLISQKIRMNYKISVKIKKNPAQLTPPLDILNAISRITMYQMQEKARNDVHKGEINQAVKHLEDMASRLLIQGNQSLANVLIREVDHLHKEKTFSRDGEKRIKYGTRALLQLPPPIKREE